MQFMAILSSYLIYVLWKTQLQAVYIRLPAIVCSILNVVGTVRTVKVFYIQPHPQFIGCVYLYIDGLLVVYTL